MTTHAVPTSGDAPIVATKTSRVTARGVASVLAVLLAGLVAWAAIATPLALISTTYEGENYERSVWWPATAAAWAPALDGWFPVFSIAGSALAVAGVLVASRRPRLGTALVAAPIGLCVLVLGTHLWAWWLALGAVAVVVAIQDPRRAIAPAALSVVVMGFYVVPPNYEAMYPGNGLGTNSGPGAVAVMIGHSAYVLAAAGAAAGLGAWLWGSTTAREASTATARAWRVETRASERATLARDLHDVVAHHVSLVAVRAESAPYVHPGLDEKARELFGEIATDARSALAELRQVLAVLHRSEVPELAPQPGADEVDHLIADARAAGQSVMDDGAWDGVPEAVGYVLYRTVQEALTNARRHAPGAPVTVVREQRGDVVGVRVSNPVVGPGGDPVPGRGLIGMRERVEAVGGTMAASATGEEFVLTVAIPLRMS